MQCLLSSAQLLLKQLQDLASVYLLPAAQLSQTIGFGDRQFVVLKRLGAGGYAFVDLVRDADAPLMAECLALKTVLAQTPALMEAVQRECSIQQALSHPSILPLLGTHTSDSDAGANSTKVHLLFPAYTDGTLAEELEALELKAITQPSLHGQKGRGASAGPLATGTMLLPVLEVLSIFQQIASGLASMHAAGYAHRDMKPHNVLFERQPGLSSPASPSMHPRTSMSIAMQPPPSESSQLLQGSLDAPDQAEAQNYGMQGQQQPSVQGAYRVCIMDFGSSCSRYTPVLDRASSMALAEDAECNCTATFRAPELMSPPTGASLDLGAADVWSLGCTLFSLMYGRSPFQVALDRGGSLALAINNAALPFPTLPPSPPGGGNPLHGGLLPFPVLPNDQDMDASHQSRLVPGHAALQALVRRMCVPDPKDRPSAQALADTAEEMLRGYRP